MQKSRYNNSLLSFSGISILLLCCSIGIPYTLSKATAPALSFNHQISTGLLGKNNFLSGWFENKHKIELPTAHLTTAPEIWSRMRQQLSLKPARSIPLFDRHVKSLAKSQDYIDMVVRNASPYLYYILEEVEKRGMPSEIALLPVIESDFNPHTLSNKGALGLWQLMPSLGRLHGLKQNSYYDGRKDVFESTKVALDHLEYLHEKFNGNWLLALAAYNCGEVRVLRAIKQNKSAKKSTDLWSLKLPKETTHFVPKLLAVAAIIKSPAKYGVNLPTIPDKPVITRVNMGKAVDIAHAAKLADISETQLRKLNPGFRKKNMNPNGPFHLVVPIQQAQNLKERAQVVKAVTQTVVKTDKETVEQSPAKVLVTHNSISAQTTAKASAKSQAKSAVTSSKTAGTIRYKIKKGDDLDKLAKKFKTTPKTLQRLNNLSSDVIITGKYLLIPTKQAKKKKK